MHGGGAFTVFLTKHAPPIGASAHGGSHFHPPVPATRRSHSAHGGSIFKETFKERQQKTNHKQLSLANAVSEQLDLHHVREERAARGGGKNRLLGPGDWER